MFRPNRLDQGYLDFEEFFYHWTFLESSSKKNVNLKKSLENLLPDWLIVGAVVPIDCIWVCWFACDEGTFNPARLVASWAIDLSVGIPSVSFWKNQRKIRQNATSFHILFYHLTMKLIAQIEMYSFWQICIIPCSSLSFRLDRKIKICYSF